MSSFDITEKLPTINIFKLNKAYYFKHFFNDPELFNELESYYGKTNYRFKMTNAGARNKVMKLLDRKGFDPNIIEDAAPYTVEICKFQNYSELLKNSIESYPMMEVVLIVEYSSINSPSLDIFTSPYFLVHVATFQQE